MELHARSAFNFLRGASNPEDMAETAAGLVDCDATALTAQSGSPPDSYIVATLQLSYANDPTPDPATASFTSSTTAPARTPPICCKPSNVRTGWRCG